MGEDTFESRHGERGPYDGRALATHKHLGFCISAFCIAAERVDFNHKDLTDVEQCDIASTSLSEL